MRDLVFWSLVPGGDMIYKYLDFLCGLVVPTKRFDITLKRKLVAMEQ